MVPIENAGITGGNFTHYTTMPIPITCLFAIVKGEEREENKKYNFFLEDFKLQTCLEFKKVCYYKVINS